MKIGASNIDKMYIGTSLVDKLYLGTTLIYERIVALYQGANPADPNNETSDVSMIQVLTGSLVLTSSTVQFDIGTRSIYFNGAGDGIQTIGIPLTGVLNGDNITVSVRIYNENVSGASYAWLDPSRGWTAPDIDGTTYQILPVTSGGVGWSTITLTNTASVNNPNLIFETGDIDFYIDNIVVTKN